MTQREQITIEEVLKQVEQWTPEQYAEVMELLNRISGYYIEPRFVATNHGTFEIALSVTKR